MWRRILGAVVATAALVGVLAFAVFPTRAYLHQRESIELAEQRAALLAEQNAELSQRVDELHTDAEIERLAREQYNLVRPGEEAYALLPAPGEAPVVQAPLPPPVRPKAPSTWDRVKDAITFWD